MNTKTNYLFFIFLSNLKIGQSQITMEELTYFDKFEEPTSLVHTGGYVTFYCDGPCDGENDLMVIDPDGEVIRNKKCDKTPPTYRLDFNNKFKLGAYGCRHKNADGPKTEFNYRICDDQEQECIEEESCTDPGKLCLITKNGPQPCSKIPDVNWCLIHPPPSNDAFFCPVDHQSLCGAFSKDYKRTWALYKGYCVRDELVPRLYYNSMHYVFYEPIHVRATDKTIAVSYSKNANLDNANLTCIIKHREVNGAVIETPNVKILHSATLTLGDAIFNKDKGSRVYEMYCKFFKHVPPFKGDLRATLQNSLVVLGGNLVINPATDGTNLSCQLNPLPSTEFRVLYWWTTQGSAVVHSGRSIIVREPTEYQCHVSIAYKTCSPHRKFELALHSEKMTVSSVPTGRSSPDVVGLSTASFKSESLDPLNTAFTACPTCVPACKPGSSPGIFSQLRYQLYRDVNDQINQSCIEKRVTVWCEKKAQDWCASLDAPILTDDIKNAWRSDNMTCNLTTSSAIWNVIISNTTIGTYCCRYQNLSSNSFDIMGDLNYCEVFDSGTYIASSSDNGLNEILLGVGCAIVGILATIIGLIWFVCKRKSANVELSFEIIESPNTVTMTAMRRITATNELVDSWIDSRQGRQRTVSATDSSSTLYNEPWF